mmetsp:Transcript_8766/g.25246  ORF Transcript_8766/g.25246 Transcript_8766/m.25246 type:complete len:210 (+) Transcript_8766:477-1106(+)
MASVRSLSMMLLRPRAPVPFLRASVAMAWRASGVTSRSASFMLSSREYCLMRAFFGPCMTWISSDSLSSWRVTMTGNRPVNSGMRPYEIRSLCSMSKGPTMGFPDAVADPVFDVIFSRMGAPNPMDDSWRLSKTCRSRSTNAPPQINRISFVSICTNSPRGFFRPPFSGTFTTVPSSIFSRACWTPSPLTSRVMDRFSLFLVTLSTSSM